MIILGESLISIMTTDVGELDIDEKFTWDQDGVPPDLTVIFFVLLTFIESYCIGRLYYNCQPSEEQILTGTDNHALRLSKERGRMYSYAHQLLFFGLLGYGIGVKIAGGHILSAKRRWIDIVLPQYSLCVIVICLNLIRVAHPFDAHKAIWVYRMLILIIMLIMPALAKTINQGIIVITEFLCIIGLVIVDVEGRAKIQAEKQEAKEKREIVKQSTEHYEMKHERSKFKQLKRGQSGIGLM